MSVEELNVQFESIAEELGLSVQSYLASCSCDAETKLALDEISHRVFEAIAQSQSALISYLNEQ